MEKGGKEKRLYKEYKEYTKITIMCFLFSILILGEMILHT